MRRYCLYCFRTQDPSGGACVCGHVTRDVDRRAYWSLHPAHVHSEQTAKILIGMLVLIGCAILIKPATGPHAGWLFARREFALSRKVVDRAIVHTRASLEVAPTNPKFESEPAVSGSR